MAADWIKMRVDLYRDPKICAIADFLMDAEGDLASYINQNTQRDMSVTRNVMRNATVGGLLSVWGVMRSRGKKDGDDLVCRGVTFAVIDDIADLQGLGEAMLQVGWVIEGDKCIVFPRFFEEHNTDPMDTLRQKNAERQRKYRERNQANNNVTRNVTDNVTITHREEKRREEYINTIGASEDTPTKVIPSVNESFEQAWKLYPKRSGSNPKNKAQQCWNARIKEGYSEQDLIAGVKRYATFCKSKQQVGSEFVMQASRFFGTGLEFENSWSAGGSLDDDDFQQQMAEIMKGAI